MDKRIKHGCSTTKQPFVDCETLFFSKDGIQLNSDVLLWRKVVQELPPKIRRLMEVFVSEQQCTNSTRNCQARSASITDLHLCAWWWAQALFLQATLWQWKLSHRWLVIGRRLGLDGRSIQELLASKEHRSGRYFSHLDAHNMFEALLKAGTELHIAI